MPSFADALDRSMETIKRPPPAPLGNYVARVAQMPGETRKTAGKDGQTYEILSFPMELIEPMDDVDTDDLEAFGKVAGTRVRNDFMFNTTPGEEGKFEGTLNRLKSFLGHLGLDADRGTLKEAIAESVNAQCLVQISHRQDPNDAEVFYHEIARTAPL